MVGVLCAPCFNIRSSRRAGIVRLLDRRPHFRDRSGGRVREADAIERPAQAGSGRDWSDIGRVRDLQGWLDVFAR
jgi:hypothetical protein